MLNHITIMGRLTRDPEIRQTQGGKSVANFSLAVDRDMKNKQTGERETDFIDVVAWGPTADFASKYLSKGRMVVADGRLQVRNWTDDNGNKRRSAEVVANALYFGDSKRDSSDGYTHTDTDTAPASDSPAEGSQFAELSDDDGDLPF